VKITRIQDLASELNVDETAVLNEVTGVIKQLQTGKSSTYYILDDKDKKNVKIISIDSADLVLINSGSDKLCVMNLAMKFNISTKEINSILNELNSRKIIQKTVFDHYMKVKDKPSIIATFEPKEIIVGEKATLTIEINTPCEIVEPTLSFDKPSSIKIDEEESSMPSKILRGKYIQAYQTEATGHGIAKIGIIFSGLIEGVQIGPEELAVATFRIKPKSPQINVSCSKSKYDAIFENPLGVFLDLTNRGPGTAQNVELEGLDNYSMFEALEPTRIGNIPPLGIVRYRFIFKPVKSGFFELDDLNIRYEDLECKPFNVKVPKIEVVVTTPQPKLRMEIVVPENIRSGKIFNIIAKLTNIGDGDARNISFVLPIDSKIIKSGNTNCYISRLRTNSSEEIMVKVQAPESKSLKLSDFEVEFEDVEEKSLTGTLQGTVIQIRPGDDVQQAPQAAVPWPFQEGKIVGGQYKILKEIGEGSFSKVYWVRRTKLNEEYALKALKSECVSNSNIVRKFLEEAAKTRILKEEHIIDAIQADVESQDEFEFPYIIMEYIKGGTLRDKLNSGESMSLAECMYVMCDICQALIVAHQKSIAHFDLKPSNIFLDSENSRWKLGDFGLARVTFADERVAHIGTLQYMAPELREGKGSTKSDIFSLGKVFKEMLTGDPNGDLAKCVKSAYGSERENLKKYIKLIDDMLKINPADRPGIGEVYRLLSDSITWDR
jgi:tRNA A-37 threonylcarbamoyl transferase component Bud32